MQIDLTSILDLQRIDVNTAVQNAIEQNEVKILDVNRLGQMDKGIGSDGQSFGDYKNFKYKGRFAPIDLKLKNDFRQAEDLKIDNYGFEFEDKDFKTPFLTKRYGNILGLTDGNIDVVGNMVLPDVIQNLENQLV